ncbi:DUF4290 domain-containing protein [Hymenobacter sp. BT770]|uniref:DUF4290 domain-containing protein n=1 Tax=Hymenobacter sp. BT770 TaxID=2886942 RepID=UPI001D11AB1F|nr:DUF4290 domain-containing protein [Hymenobacter sp. BT770]MCC3152387.1 DUF4290 domain-containing protein [Hymenobacter sp. BT770]MDO3414637.1 DUF4290 domain-containing protein [Hymenobacter sp. BT770]
MTDLTTLPFHLQLLVREYGHSTYQLIQGLAQIEDLAERTKRAGQIVQLMLRLQPSLRELPEVQTRLWNHLHAMAGEEVTLDAPVPLRSLTIRTEKPTRVPYPRQAPKLRAYGAAVEALIAKALTIEDPAEREQATVQIGRTMKFLYRQHNKENAKDVTILRHLGELSGGQLRLDPAVVDSESLFEMPAGTGRTPVFIVPQPQQREGRDRRESRDNRDGRNGGFGNKGGKKRKKGRQEPQQPPQ